MANLPKELNIDALKKVSEQVNKNLVYVPMTEEEGTVYAALVNDKLYAVYQSFDEAMEWMAYDEEITDAIIEEYHIYSQGQRGRKYKVCPKTGDYELIKHIPHIEGKMRDWSNAVDGVAYDMEDPNTYAYQVTIDCFDIPSMVSEIQQHGYDVTEDMLTRWLTLWLQREGKTFLMERGITLYSACSCCNPFNLLVEHNGDPTLEELYAV